MNITKKWQKTAFCGVLVALLYLIPDIKYKILALFLYTISNFAFQIFDAGTMAILSLALGMIFQIFSASTALQTFSNSIIWQILCFLFMSKALIRSGLAEKISIYMIYICGKSQLSLTLGFSMLTVFFSILLPTSTARIGGLFLPILVTVFALIPKESENIKSAIIKVVLYTNTIASAMFFTASAGNLYVQELTKNIGIIITPKEWMLNGIVPGIVAILGATILINYLHPVEKNDLKILKEKMKNEITKLQPLKKSELLILAIFTNIFIMSLIDCSIPLLGILLMSIFVLLASEIIDFEEDILSHKEAWSLFFWMSNLLMLSSLITEHNSFEFLQHLSKATLQYVPTNLTFLFLLVFYGYSQYLFASTTVHIGALYLICLQIFIQNGYAPFSSALNLAYVSSLFGGLTTYTASEVILVTNTFNCNPKEFNKSGLIISTLIFILWQMCGTLWWKLTGVM